MKTQKAWNALLLFGEHEAMNMAKPKRVLTCFCSVLVLLLAMSMASICKAQARQPGSPEFYEKSSSWQETMLASRDALKEQERESNFKPFVSDVIRGGQPAQRVTVNVAGLDKLWLVADDAGDGIGCDHSSWGDPKLLAKDGTETIVSTLEPVFVQVGWNKFHRDEDHTNRPIHIAGREFKHGLFVHAQSVVCYSLDKKYEKFEAWIGLSDTSRGGGSVRFKVLDQLDRATLASALWPKIEEDFPAQTAFMKRDLPRREHIAWFSKDGNIELEKKMIGHALDPIGQAGGRLRKAFETLLRTKAAPNDRRWLDLYVEIAQTREALENTKSALDLARKTLAFVERSAPRPKMAARLASLETLFKHACQQSDADWKSLHSEIRSLRRRIIMSHPLLSFDKLLITKRPPPGYSHECDQYLGRHSGEGPGLVVLESWKDNPKENVLLKGKLPKGSVLHPDLSLDAKRVVFSFCDHTVENKNHRRFFIFEASLDGGEVRQITGTRADPLRGAGGRQTILIEDWDPCYLPDGGIAFVSTRSQDKGRCHGGRYTPSYLLYRMNADGTDIHELSFGESNEWNPSCLPDGRIIYTRWDYINRHDVMFQSLWVMRPDGTGTAHFYGNSTRSPCRTAEALAIPNTHKVVCTAAAHHSYTAGSIIVIDPLKGQEGAAPIARVTPEISFPEGEAWPEKGSFATPYPLSEDLFLAAYSPDRLVSQGSVQRRNAYAIYLIDTLGGRELVYRDSDCSCFSPIPVKPRPKPPVITSLVASKREEKTGTFYVQDVYRSTQPIPRGSVKGLRINRIIPQPATSAPPRGQAQNEIVKAIVGTVPVSPDGSVAFRAPAGAPLQLQLLDENGMAVMTMRSFVYLQPGEVVTCVGCHESRSVTPTGSSPLATLMPHDPSPPAGPHYEGGFSFTRTVQPVLDRYCIDCHGLDRTDGDVNLLGTPKNTIAREGGESQFPANTAYCSLVNGHGLTAIARRNREAPYSKPNDYFAHAGRLAKMLLEGHNGYVKLESDSLQRIIDWLDLNVQFYGDYSFNRPEQRRISPDGEKALREHIERVFGAKLAKQPFAALVNISLPSESRILKAPLSERAGGWGQIKENGWSSANHPGYKKMLQLVEASILPLDAHDLAGTCGRKRCRCGSCWVRAAEAEYRNQIAKK